MPEIRIRKSDQRLLLGVLALCILVSYAALFYIKRDGLPYRDFKIFYAGARIIRSMPGAQLYDMDLQSRVQQDLLHIRPEETLPYNHPPFELVLFLPLSGLSYYTAFYIWLLFSGVLAIASAAMIGRELKSLTALWSALPYALVVCLFPFFMVILEGQDSAVALFLLVAAWVALRRDQDVRGGFWLGLALFKFQVFLPLSFLLALRKPKLLKGFAASAALLAIVSALMIGPAGVVSYVHSLTHMARASSEGVSLQYGMDPRLIPNLRGLLYGIISHGQPSLAPSWTNILLAAVAVLSALILGWTARRIFAFGPDSTSSPEAAPASEFDVAFALAVVVSLLLSFHILAHDLTLLALPIAILTARSLAPAARIQPRYIAFIGLASVFYLYVIYLILFAKSLMFLLGMVLIALACLIPAQLSPLSPPVDS